MNENAFNNAEEAMNKKGSFEGAKKFIEEMESKIKKLGTQAPREYIMKTENVIIFEVMPILEEKRKKLEESFINTEEKIKNAPDVDAAEFYQECLKSDKKEVEELKAEIEKYQNILDTFQQ